MNASRSSFGDPLRAGLAALLLLMGGCDAPAADHPQSPIVDAQRLTRVLAATPSPHGTNEGELAFFASRLEADPTDVLALRRAAGTHLLRFRAYNDLQELEGARAHLACLAARDPRDAGMLALTTTLALAGHDFGGALEAARLRRAHADPGTDDALLGLFDALWATGRYAEARELLERAPVEGESLGRLAREARLVDGLGDVEGAERRMARVVELVDAYAEPAVVRAWARVEHGNFLLHSGRPTAAADRFDQALALVPAYPAALEGLGWIAYGVDENPDVAQPLFERSLAYGRHLDLYPLLEEIAHARGDTARAHRLRRDFIDLATADPTRRRLYRRPLALTLADDPARLDEALAYAETDLRHRRDRMAWATRGWVLHRMGRTAEAVADMERALAWGAPPPEVLYRAGVVFEAAGKARRGRELLAEALEGRAELGPVVAREIEER